MHALNEPQTYLIVMSYDGTHYFGWQKQPLKSTIQSNVEYALNQILSEPLSLVASGRTDTGVHARRQYISFITSAHLPPLDSLCIALNRHLPKDIRILEIKNVPLAFNARKHALFKTYRYFFKFSPVPDVFLQRYMWFTHHDFEIKRMQDSIAFLKGEHDFKAFQTHGDNHRSTTRTIYNIQINSHEDHFILDITGNGFLRHMVRTLMGTVYEIGSYRKDPSHMRDVLESKSRRKAGITAPAQGLFLWDVEYDNLF